jgi:hypothetical protein
MSHLLDARVGSGGPFHAGAWHSQRDRKARDLVTGQTRTREGNGDY